MVEFAAPIWLAAILVNIVLAFRAWRTQSTPMQVPALRHPFVTFLPLQSTPVHHHPIRWWYVAMALAVLALTQPQWLSGWVTRSEQQRDIMIALDVSASMRAEDFVWNGQVVNRLTATINLLQQLFAARPGDRFGIQIFGEDSFTLTPLTADTALLNELLAEIQPGIAGEKTALGDALLASVQRLAAKPSTAQKVLILFSDGTRTAGYQHPFRALSAARTHAVRIHTVGIGRNEPVPFPGAVTETPKLVRLPLDETTLQKLATDTGGTFFHVRSAQDLAGLTEQLGELEPTRVVQYAQERTALYWIPLIGALLSALIGYRSMYWGITPMPLR